MNKSGIRLLLLILFIVLSMISCKSLPKPKDNESALLLIPRELQNNTSTNPFRYYVLKLDDGKGDIRIDAKNSYAIIDKLAPGKYTISKIRSIHKNTYRPREENVFIGFELKEGEITIFPRILRVTMKKENSNSKSKYFQYWKLDHLSENEIKAVKNDLIDFKNIELWDIETN